MSSRECFLSQGGLGWGAHRFLERLGKIQHTVSFSNGFLMPAINCTRSALELHQKDRPHWGLEPTTF